MGCGGLMPFDGNAVPVISYPDHEGAVSLTWDSKTLSVRFGLRGLDQIQKAYGADFLQSVSEALDHKAISRLVELAAFASGKEQDEIWDMDPPALLLAQALTSAWGYAWRGTRVQIDDDGDDAPEKMNAPATLWGRFSRWLSGVVFPFRTHGT